MIDSNCKIVNPGEFIIFSYGDDYINRLGVYLFITIKYGEILVYICVPTKSYINCAYRKVEIF